MQFCHGRIRHRQQSASEEPQRTHGQCNAISTSPFPPPFLRSHLSYLESINSLSKALPLFFSHEFYNRFKQSTCIESSRSCWTPGMADSCLSSSFPVESYRRYALSIKFCSTPYWFFSHTMKVKCDRQCGSGLVSCLIHEH